jgi:pilus assembly protein CpaE
MSARSPKQARHRAHEDNIEEPAFEQVEEQVEEQEEVDDQVDADYSEEAAEGGEVDLDAQGPVSVEPVSGGGTRIYPLSTILIACDDADVSDLRAQLHDHGVTVENAFADVRTTMAGLAARSMAEKKVFVIHVRTAADLRQLERLNDAFPGWPILVLLGGGSNVNVVFHAMRAGAAQVVPLPLDGNDFKQALDRIARQFGHAAASCKVIAISGVTGGCGATTIAINLAGEVARLHGVPCVLAEMSLGMGRLASYLDISPRYSTHDLLREMDRLDLEAVRNALTPVADNFHVLAGPYKGISTSHANPQAMLNVVDYLRRLARVVILDMHSFDEAYFQTMAAADCIVLVAEQKVPSVHALKTVRDELQKHEGMAPQTLVINRFNARSDLSLLHVQELLGVSHMYHVANDWNSVGRAVDKGRLLSQENPDSQALEDIATIADFLLGTETEHRPRAGFGGFLRRLLGKS